MRADAGTARGRFLEATRASDSNHPALILQMLLTSLGALSLPIGAGGDNPLAAACGLAGPARAPAPPSKPLDVARFQAYWDEVFKLGAWPADAWTDDDRSRCQSEYELLEDAVLEVAGPLAQSLLRESLGVAWYEVVRGVLQANAFRTASTLPPVPLEFPSSGSESDGEQEAPAAAQAAVVLFPVDISLCNHSCQPNCGVALASHPTKGPLAILRTKRPVAAGEEATISYLSEGGLGEAADGRTRYEQLRLGFGFECECGGTCVHDA